MQKLGSFSM